MTNLGRGALHPQLHLKWNLKKVHCRIPSDKSTNNKLGYMDIITVEADDLISPSMQDKVQRKSKSKGNLVISIAPYYGKHHC